MPDEGISLYNHVNSTKTIDVSWGAARSIVGDKM
jgi:hypothetical protein